MKKYFITGLVILLPLALTLAIVSFVVNMLTVPFLGIVKPFFEHYHLFSQGFLLFTQSDVQNLVAQGLILISLFFITVGLGFIARWFFFNQFLDLAEYIVKKIPLVSSIYKTCQDVIKTLFTSNTNSFKQVVLVPFPHPESYTIGLVTSEEIKGLEGTSFKQSVTVFIPTAPNPMSGFLLLYKVSDLIFLDMKVEDAFKSIISCGVIPPSFVVSKETLLSVEKEESEKIIV